MCVEIRGSLVEVTGVLICNTHWTISTAQVLLLNNNVYMQYMLLLKWIIKIFAITKIEKNSYLIFILLL